MAALTPPSPGCTPIETTSAGGILLRFSARHVEILVGKRTKRVEPKWAPVLCQLPKGRVDVGESLEVAATREVLEETGYTGIIREKAGIASWTYERGGKLWREVVHYFFMTINEGAGRSEHDQEFDDLVWCDLNAAIRDLSYPEERALIKGLNEGSLLKAMSASQG